MHASPTSGDTKSHLQEIPDHVPSELVHAFDFRTGLGNYPHSTVAELHNSPRIFLFTHASQRDSGSRNLGAYPGRRYPRGASGCGHLLERGFPLELVAETDTSRNGSS